ncbi:MAG: V-type ATP synthase subunit E family protein [Candidatus Micrarchaeota archaeon]|nr:V-type ATP synthase subunit E family protein [Candidatus Micrarchaeota archaeon]
MGFEELAAELQKQAEAEGKRLLASAEKNAKKAEEEAEAKADEMLRAARKEAQSYVKQESAERLTSAKLSAKKIIDEARDDAVEASLEQVWGAFKSSSLRKENYPAILRRLIEEGVRELGARQAIVYVRDSDLPLVSGYRTARLPAEYSGGAIVESEDGKIRVNKTLGEVFAQAKAGLRKKIYDRLFG